MILFPDETADGLYAGVIDDPGNDLRRLVLSDRMEEIGLAEWAEFVRVSVELTHEMDAADRNRMAAREEELFHAHCDRWFPVPAGFRFDWHIGLLHGDPHRDHGYVIRRGFPTEVRAPLAWLLGGLCDGCWGHGTTSYAGPDECPDCHGTGRTPGHLAGLVRKWPITTCMAVGLEPQEWDHDWHYDEFAWIVDIGQGGDGRVPLAAWNKLIGGRTSTPTVRVYSSRDLALAALSDAILRLVRG